MSAKLKQQTTDLLLGNNDTLKLIAEAVSSLIVDTSTNSEETIGQIAENISKKPDFIKAVKMTTTEQEPMKQEMNESLPFDYQRLQEKHEKLEGICRELSARNNDPAWEFMVAHKCKTNVSFQNNIYLFETLCSFFKTNYTLFKTNVSFQNKCFISKQMFHFKANVSFQNKCFVSKQMFSFQNKCFVPLS